MKNYNFIIKFNIKSVCFYNKNLTHVALKVENCSMLIYTKQVSFIGTTRPKKKLKKSLTTSVINGSTNMVSVKHLLLSIHFLSTFTVLNVQQYANANFSFNLVLY